MARTKKERDASYTIRAGIVNFREEYSARSEVRLLKATALYADDVVLFSSALHTCAQRPLRVCADDREAKVVRLACDLTATEPDEGRTEDPAWPDYWYAPYTHEELRALLELCEACAHGLAVPVPIKIFETGPLMLMMGVWNTTSMGIPVSDEESIARLEGITTNRLRQVFPDAPGPSGFVPTREGLIVSQLMGSLPAFPEADWDSIRDVRDQLTDARVRFQRAVRSIADETADTPVDRLPDAVSEIQRSFITPAMLDIDEELQELGALPTLLRLSSDQRVVGTALAALAVTVSTAVGTAAPGLGAAAASTATLAAAAKEASFRRSENAKRRTMPYWLLREADRRLRERLRARSE